MARSPCPAWPGTAATASGPFRFRPTGAKPGGSAALGQDLGKYAFRPWSFELRAKRGKNTVMVNATNKIGQAQVTELLFNGAGYHNNVMQNITLNAG